jgi:lipid II isoglutaminyl synthase (glutamine-hydrolysing)
VTVRVDRSEAALPARAALAAVAVRTGNGLSRLLGRGSGTVVGGRAGLLVDPHLLETLARGRAVALVSGTNGKTTVTRMLVAALEGVLDGAVATNATGANMPAGHVAALVASPRAEVAVLEVDESYLGHLVEAGSPRVVVLLNLSRDQLDRIAEVRMLVERWRTALAGSGSDTGRPAPVVVANADDPMVAWAARDAPRVRWVGAGQVWHDDAVGCPACGAQIAFGDDGRWACERCDFARPEPEAWLEREELALAGGGRRRLALRLPGQFNRANALMAAVAACSMLDTPDTAGPIREADPIDAVLSGIAAVDEVAGRFSVVQWRGRPVRLLLAKNPAGWTAVFDLLEEERAVSDTVVVAINARTADGLDPSWLWDVPFERLRGRTVVATGDRRLDLAVRLHYAEVDHVVVADPLDALDRAASADPGLRVEFLGNYTAFAELRRRL